MPTLATIQQTLANPSLLLGWSVLVGVSVIIVLSDLSQKNSHLGSLMKVVWVLTVLYSGPLGLAVYWFSGRAQIPYDSLWRRGFRSVSHCYSGCGAGEILGVLIAAGLLNLDTSAVVVTTFAFAYLIGYLLTVGPLMQDGVPFSEAVADAFYTETTSITVMEVVAVSVDIIIAGDAALSDPLFWAALGTSLTVGFLAAYPVNVALIHLGVKDGMMSPTHNA